MDQFARMSRSTIALSVVVLVGLAGNQAGAADKDLKPAIQEMRDEIRELRRDVKSLRELLEQRETATAAADKARREPLRESTLNEQRPVAYFFYSKWCGACKKMIPIVDRLQAEGFPITKVDVDRDSELRQRFNVTTIPTLWIELGRPEFVPLSGVQTEEATRSWLRAKNLRPVLGPAGAGSEPLSHQGDGTPVAEKPREAPSQTVRDAKWEAALQRFVSIDCDKLPLRQFVGRLLKAADVAVDAELAGTEVDTKAPITLHASGITLGAALKRGLDQAKARYEFQNQSLVLLHVEPLLLLAYPVADLLTNSEPQSGVVRAEKIDFNSLEKLMRTAVEPSSWSEAGGQGRIQHAEKTLTLVIQQTQPVHDQIRNLLQELRKSQQLKITFRTVLFDRDAADLIRAAGIDTADRGGKPTLIARDWGDVLLKLAADTSRLLTIPTVSADVGKEMLIRPFPGEHVWPETIQAFTGQIGGRAYIWFELTGNDPLTGQSHREGVMSLSPDFKPVLIPVRAAETKKRQEWPLGPERTVDDWAKVPERKFLLIRPLVERSETLKEQEEILR